MKTEILNIANSTKENFEDSSSNEPLVSIIVITYNSGRYIIETLESIRLQTYNNLELIISDDHSSDDALLKCNDWLNAYKNRFISHRIITSDANTGITKNCNRGLHASSGSWFKIIAGDDVLESTVIMDYIKYVQEKAEKVAAVFSKVRVYEQTFDAASEKGIKNTLNGRFNSPECLASEQFQILLRDNCVDAPSVMLNTEVVKELGGFDENFTFLEDWPMWLALTKAGHKMHYIDMVGIKYRMHSQSVQTLNGNKYNSITEIEVDKMFMRKYNIYLPFFEKLARILTVYRNSAIRKLFGNKSNFFIASLSRAIGFIPRFILKQYKKPFFS